MKKWIRRWLGLDEDQEWTRSRLTGLHKKVDTNDHYNRECHRITQQALGRLIAEGYPDAPPK